MRDPLIYTKIENIGHILCVLVLCLKVIIQGKYAYKRYVYALMRTILLHSKCSQAITLAAPLMVSAAQDRSVTKEIVPGEPEKYVMVSVDEISV